jgi:hypothetical protein
VTGGQDDFGTCFGHCDPRVGCVEHPDLEPRVRRSVHPRFERGGPADRRALLIGHRVRCRARMLGVRLHTYCTVDDDTCLLPMTCVTLLP